MKLTKDFSFDASHRLPRYKGPCNRLHGHRWTLTVEVEGLVDPESGMVIDYREIARITRPIIDQLDHRHLGTWEGIDIIHRDAWKPYTVPLDFYPTSENLLYLIADQIGATLPWSQLSLRETPSSGAMLSQEDYRRTRDAVSCR